MALFGMFGRGNTAEATVKVNYDGRNAEKGLNTLKGAIGGVVSAFALKQIGEFTLATAKLGAQADMVSRNFAKFAKQRNRDENDMMMQLRKATKGMVDDMKLQQDAMKAMIGGVSFDDMIVAMEFVTNFAAATGADVNQKMTTVMTGLARKSAQFLDDVGIQVMGAQDVVGAAIDQMKEKMDSFAVSGDDAAVKAAELTANLKTLQQNTGKLLIPTFNKLASSLNDIVVNMDILINQAEDRKKAAENEEFISEKVRQRAEAVIELRQRIDDARKANEKFVEGLSGRMITLEMAERVLERSSKGIQKFHKELVETIKDDEVKGSPIDMGAPAPADKGAIMQAARERQNAEKVAEQARREVLRQTLQGRVQLLTENFEKQKELLEKHGEDTTNLEEKFLNDRWELYQEDADNFQTEIDRKIEKERECEQAIIDSEQRITDEQMEQFMRRRQIADDFFSHSSTLVDSIMALNDAQTAKEIRNLDMQRLGRRAYDREVAKIEAQAADRMRVFARIEQGILLGETIMNMSTAIMKALKNDPGPLGWLNVGLIGATGAVNIERIQAQSFEQGGLIGDLSRRRDKDDVMALLGRGEFVMPAPQTARNIELLESIKNNTASSGMIKGQTTHNYFGLSTEQVVDVQRENERRNITGVLI